MFRRSILTALLFLCMPTSLVAQQINKEIVLGPETGLPLPRFVSLKVDAGNMRVQPSTNHARSHIYLREGLPFKVLEERGDWRRVEDYEGVQGWMKNTILSNNRTFRVMVPMANLYVRADMQSPVRAELEERVVGNLNFCRIDGWCRADLPEASGWILAQDIWGVMPGEEF